MVSVCLSVVLVAAFFPPMVWAESSVLRVPQDYPTIKQALNATDPGDTIIVSEGTYAEGEIWITKPNLTLIANGTVVVDGLQEGWVFYVIADSVTIKGFTVKRSAVGWYYSGICLDHAHNCTIENNTVINSGDGILLFASSNNTVAGNNASFNHGHGILLDYSDYNIVTNNTATNNYYNGINVRISADGNTLSGNMATNNRFSGISVSGVNNTLIKNTATNNKSCGIKLSDSSTRVGLRYNNMTGNVYNLAIMGDLATHDVDPSNIVDGKRVYYLINQDGITVDSSTFPDLGYLGIINSTGVIVRNITIRNNWDGVLLAFVTNSTVENVNVTNNYCGIYLHGCSSNTLVGNSATENEMGIELYGGSGEHTLLRNYLVNNKVGIRLSSGSNNSVLYNIVANNTWAGIRVVGYDNIIRGNLVANNAHELSIPPGGITLEGGRNTIYENTLVNNLYGMFLLVSPHNTIYHNNFVDNTIQVHAGTIGYVSTWDDGYPSGGNYWSDYNGTDSHSEPPQNRTESDGVGDDPYTININNTDRYPLMAPFDNNVAVLDIKPYNRIVEPGRSVLINVTVQNQGFVRAGFKENFTISVYANETLIAKKTVSLVAGASSTLNFTWNTTSITKGSYKLTAEASAVPKETNTADNSLIDGVVWVMIPGDVNHDEVVDIYDIVTIAAYYGANQTHPKWDKLVRFCDSDGNGKITINDIVIACANYRKTDP